MIQCAPKTAINATTATALKGSMHLSYHHVIFLNGGAPQSITLTSRLGGQARASTTLCLLMTTVWSNVQIAKHTHTRNKTREYDNKKICLHIHRDGRQIPCTTRNTKFTARMPLAPHLFSHAHLPPSSPPFQNALTPPMMHTPRAPLLSGEGGQRPCGADRERPSFCGPGCWGGLWR